MSRVSNEKGMTLLEILVAVLIIGMIVTGISYLFTTGLANSYKEEKKDAAVQIARDLMEEMKLQLKSASATISYRSQTIRLDQLRGTAESTQSLKYPGAGDPQYTITIANKPFDDKKYILNGTNKLNYEFSVREFYSLIQIDVVNQTTGSTYTLQSYVEKK